MIYATIDIETTGLNRYTDEITCIGIGLTHSFEDKKFFKAWILDMDEEGSKEKLLSIIQKLKAKKAKCIWQNGKFDTLFIEWKYGKEYKLPISEDVMLMGTAYDLAAEHGLKKMARAYLGVEDWDISKNDKLLKTKKTKGVNPKEQIAEIKRKTLFPYLKKDVKYTWLLARFFMHRLTSEQNKLYRELLRPAYLMYRDIERTGIWFDHEEFKNVQKKYRDLENEKLRGLKKRYDINWNSPAQKAQALFIDPKGEKLPILKTTPKGAPSADASTLKKLAAQGHELPQLMLEYTAANTLNKMFLNRWGEDSSYDGRIHPCFNLTNVVSGRTSCLVGDTEIMIPSGTRKIKDINVGDLVYTRKENGDITLKKVTWSDCTGIRDDLYRITYKTQGEHKELSLILTSDHLVNTVEKGYVQAKDLKVGDRLNTLHRGFKYGRYQLYWTGNHRMDYWGIQYDGRKPEGQRLILQNNHYITKIERLDRKEKVYDLTVEDTHNFYANEICVHNCTDPNLQQVPRTPDVRALFNAPEGRCFFEADYSQLELRIAAHYANEPTMLRIYRENGDIHTETAKLMTGGREPTKDERRKAKAVNFGFLYGMGAKKFVDYAYDSYGVVFSLPEAQKFRELFFAKYSRLLPWHEEQRHIAEALGGVPNLFGRFRKLPKIYADNWKDKGEAERRSINTPVQGSGSDILLSAAIEVKKTLEPYGLKIVGTVHDSILGEFPEENKDFIVSEIRRIMKHPALLDEFGIELRCPLDCDIGVGPWGTH